MSKKSRLDLLVRVRYLNPIPEPPFPPKLFDVATDINRLGEPSYLGHLASSTPLPMLVDAEMGMPLDLNVYTKIWEGDDRSINPQPQSEDRRHHPTDVLLLTPSGPPPPANGFETASTVADVSWMRNSNLFTRKAAAKKREPGTTAENRTALVDCSEAAQLRAVEQSFQDIQGPQLRHPDPKKRHLTVIETYDVLPDVATWSNNYIVLKFPDTPTAATAIDPSATATVDQLNYAKIRPVIDDEDDQQVMEYYLPQSSDRVDLLSSYSSAVDEAAVSMVDQLCSADDESARAKIDDVLPNTLYDRVRTYEVITQSNRDNDLLLVFQEDDLKRKKGAYYRPINMRSALRKTRQKRERSVKDSWDRTRVGYRLENEEEGQIRRRGLSSVQDPDWLQDRLHELATNAAEGLGEAIDEENINVD